MSKTDQFWQYAKEAMLAALCAKTDHDTQRLYGGPLVRWAGPGLPNTPARGVKRTPGLRTKRERQLRGLEPLTSAHVVVTRFKQRPVGEFPVQRASRPHLFGDFMRRMTPSVSVAP
jgi:hypothetical protein